MKQCTRRRAAAIITPIAAAAVVFGVTGTASATEARDCSDIGPAAFESLSYTFDGVEYDSISAFAALASPGDTFTVTATLAEDCGDTPHGIAFHATASMIFDAAETQPLIAFVPLNNGATDVTIPASTTPGQCNVQVDDALIDAGMPFVDPAHRYNEPSADRDGDGVADGEGINRLIGAGYVAGECVEPEPEPEPTTTTSTSTPQPVEQIDPDCIVHDLNIMDCPLDPAPTTSAPITRQASDPIPSTTSPVVTVTLTTLPFTGSQSEDMARFGAIVLAAGALSVIAARRLRTSD